MSKDNLQLTPTFDSVILEIDRTLGRGGFGVVVLVRAAGENGVKHEFALKRTSLAQLTDAGAERAVAEARLLQSLSKEHSSVLRCYDFRMVLGSTPVLELLLELAPLGDLCNRIRSFRHSRDQQDHGLPEVEVVYYGCDVSAGLAHIHSRKPKVFHRDIKPANIVLFPPMDGVVPRAKLADFGIAKILETDGTATFGGAKTVIGTPHYFSPEICSGETYDDRSDTWALGCVLYEMICLHRPFHQAEGNIAVLAIRVSEGTYDEEALGKQAGSYNGSLIYTLVGLLRRDMDRRMRAAAALEALTKLKTDLDGGAKQSSAANALNPWWLDSGRDLSCEEHADNVTQLPESNTTDSWFGARGLGDDVTADPFQDITQTPLPWADDALTELPFSYNRLTPVAEVTAEPGGHDFNEGHNFNETEGLGLGTEFLDRSVFSECSLGDTDAMRGVPSRMAWGGPSSFASRPPTAEPSMTPEPSRPATAAPPESRAPPPPASAPLGRAQSEPASPAAPKRVFFRPLWPSQRSQCNTPGGADFDDATEEIPMVFCFPRGGPQEFRPATAASAHTVAEEEPERNASFDQGAANGWREVSLAPPRPRPDDADDGIFSLTCVE